MEREPNRISGGGRLGRTMRMRPPRPGSGRWRSGTPVERFHCFLGLPVEFEVEMPPRIPSARFTQMTVRRQAGDTGGDLATQTPATGAPLRGPSASGVPLRGSSASGAPEGEPPAQSTEVHEAAAVCSSERPIGSRFWALQSDDEDEVGSEDEEEVASGDEGSSVREGFRLASYLCRTPSPSRDADLFEGSSELNQRQLKRLRRRDGQRLATRAALFFSSGEGYPYGVTLGPVVGSSVTGGTAGCYGYWMHTAPDGRSGYLVPGWLAAQ